MLMIQKTNDDYDYDYDYDDDFYFYYFKIFSFFFHSNYIIFCRIHIVLFIKFIENNLFKRLQQRVKKANMKQKLFNMFCNIQPERIHINNIIFK